MFPAILRPRSNSRNGQEQSDDTMRRGSSSRYDGAHKDKDPDELELVGGGSDNKNWRGIIISLLVIMLIVSLIVIAAFIVMPDNYLPKEFLFDDIFNETFKPSYHEMQWISGSKYVFKDQFKNILWRDLETEESDILITNRTLDDEQASNFWVNADMTHILLACYVKSLYRYSSYAKYKIYDIETELLVDLTAPGLKEVVDLRYAGWAQTGSALVFVYKNNLYYMDSVPQEYKVPAGNTAQQVTTTGQEGVIFHGVPDWVYEEEVLAKDNALYWSQDGASLVYATFNDSGIEKSWYPKYDNLLYSKVEELAYPKAGFANPTISLQVVNVSDLGNPITLVPPEIISKKDYYYQHVVWVDTNQVAVVWLNRPQNVSILTLCQVKTGECTINHDLRTPDGWVVDRGPPIFSKGSSELDYVRILPQREGSSGDYLHLALVSTHEAPGQVTFLTRGRWEVTEIVAYDKSEKLVYFLSTERSIRGRHLYSVSTEEPNKRTCLSCDGQANCTYYSAAFSPDGSWFKLNCLGFAVPHTIMKKTGTDRSVVVETNEVLAKALKEKSFPNKTFMELEVGDYTIPIQLWEPRVKDEKRKHPILVNVYGGPGSQMVNDKFELGWNAYLSSKYYVIIVNIDGRGSGFQGQKHLYKIFKRLGTYEVEDQLIAVRHILKNIEYVNTTKVGIWGWSYGGFVASMALSYGDDEETFKYGIAVAPVTDFRYYDSIYTERYMGCPAAVDNLQGYKLTNVSSRAKAFKGRNYFLIHGTADDNVHFQNSADLVRSLVQEEVMLRTQYYPDQKHDLDDPHVERHLYNAMSEFVHESIQKKDQNTEL
ncbi:A-type potassium channel modulatory protein DPP6-like isoform X4 [Asterias amurensis]|uniref:A-type potassium channel modulatory protein DPP6-like isoform X4 n=1 Tax=Asterias amurensis TaxID=7602 RepID=UPI003AB72B86